MAQTLTVELADRSYPIHFSDSRAALKATVAELRTAKRSVRVIADAGLMAARILANEDPRMRERLRAWTAAQTQSVMDNNEL